jgi:hypothetical protein
MTSADQKTKNGKPENTASAEPVYPAENRMKGKSVLELITPSKDSMKFDENVDMDTINSAVKEILKRKQFWEKYALLKELEVNYSNLFAELKRKKVAYHLVEQILNGEMLTIIENSDDQSIDLDKVEMLVKVIKNENIKEDVLKGAVPLLLSDKKNEAFSVFYLVVKKFGNKTDPRIIVSCIEGMLYMTYGLEGELDGDRLASIRSLIQRFLDLHTTPASIKNSFEYAKEMGCVHYISEIIKYTGRIIKESSITAPDVILDFVRAIDINTSEFEKTALNLNEVVDTYMIKELIICGKIMLACKLAHRYGVTADPEKEEIYRWLQQIYEAQNRLRNGQNEQLDSTASG